LSGVQQRMFLMLRKKTTDVLLHKEMYCHFYRLFDKSVMYTHCIFYALVNKIVYLLYINAFDYFPIVIHSWYFNFSCHLMYKSSVYLMNGPQI